MTGCGQCITLPTTKKEKKRSLACNVTLIALELYGTVSLGLGPRFRVRDGLVVSFYFTTHGKNFWKFLPQPVMNQTCQLLTTAESPLRQYLKRRGLDQVSICDELGVQT